MKRPSIFIYQFHRRRIIQAQGLYLYLISPRGISRFSPNLIARFHFLALKPICRRVVGEILPLGVHGSDMSNVA